MNIEYGLYIVLGTGILIFQHSLIIDTLQGLKNRIILRQNFKKLSETSELKKYGKICSNILNLIEAIHLESKISRPEYFLAFSIIIAIGIGFCIFWIEGISMALISGAFFGLMPYMCLLLKLNKQRVKNSREGDVMINELLSNYKVCNYNILEAIQSTADGLESSMSSKILLYDLAKKLNRAYTEKEAIQALNFFKFSVNTTWGNILATNIFFAHVRGLKIAESLNDLAHVITEAAKVIEIGRRENNEAQMILKYLAPISYVLSLICACKFFNFTLSKFILYQFFTPLGIKWFIIIVIFYAIAVMSNSYLSKEKMDI